MLADFTYTMVGNAVNGTLKNTTPYEFDFQTDEYEVCVLDMLFIPGAWDNVRAEANTIILREELLVRHVQIDKQSRLEFLTYTVRDITNVEFFTVPPGNYHTRKEFFQVVNKAMNSKAILISTPGTHIDHANSETTVIIIPPTETRRQYVNHPKTYKIQYSLQFCNELAYLMGLIPALTLPVPAITDEWKCDTRSINPHRNNLTRLWMFGDFVQNTIIANLTKPLLRFIPVRVGSGIMEHAIFSVQNYTPVSRQCINRLCITLQATVNGTPLKMHDQIALTLHFSIKQ